MQRRKAKTPSGTESKNSRYSDPLPKGQKHRATYATDKRNGGYLIRVSGPHAERFAGKEVPVNTKAGVQHKEKLQRLIWTGADKESGEKVALYKFEAKPREVVEDDVPF